MPTEKIQLDKPLTAQQKIDYNGFRLAGVSPQRALDRILGNGGDSGLEQNKVLARGTDNFLKDLGGDLVETGKGVFDTVTTAGDKIRDIAGEEDRGIFSKALGIGGEAFRGIGRTIGEVFIGGAKAVVPQSVEDKVGETVEKGGQKVGEAAVNYATENPDSQVVQTVKGLIEKYENDKNFRDAVNAGGGFAEGLAEIVGGGVATKGLKKGLDAGKEAAESVVQQSTNIGSRFGALLRTPDTTPTPGKALDTTKATPDTVTPNPGIVGKAKETAGKAVDKGLETAVDLGHKAMTKYQQLSEGSTQRITQNLDRKALRENAVLPPKQVDKNLGEMYVNAVSPGVKGKKKTLDGITKNRQSAVDVIKDITINKNKVSFKDSGADIIVSGEVPNNLWEFGGAMQSRKSTIYKGVLEDVGKAAKEPTDFTRIINVMEEIIKDPVYAKETAIIDRAKQILAKFSENTYGPEQIERLLQIENLKLDQFYKGKGKLEDSVVSAIVANHLRDILNETVEKAVGQGVKEKKRLYGAYKAVEEDVVHRAIHNSQARKAGLVNMFGIKTVGDLTEGLAGNPGALKQAVGQIVGESFISALNDRDALINRMFLVADQTYNK